MINFNELFEKSLNLYGNKSLNIKIIEKTVRSSVIINAEKPKVFDWKRYMKENTNIQYYKPINTVTAKDVCCHYLNHGRKEKRKKYISNSTQPYIYDFDWKTYNKLNPEVFTQYSRGDKIAEWHAFSHWCDIGHSIGCNTTDQIKCANTKFKISTDSAINTKWNSYISTYLRNGLNTITALINAVIEDYEIYVEHTCKLDFSTFKNVNNECLSKVYKNIDYFSNFIKKYKNILFICSDFPGYGGAATNCNKLSEYYAKTHNVKTIYWKYTNDNVDIPDSIKEKYKVVLQNQLETTLKQLRFKPSIIILKNSINDIDLKTIFSCPVIFLIPGIYKNNLNVHYTELDTIEKQNEYINHSIIKQIKSCEYNFCNSSHTHEILHKWYNLKTDMFYSSFIQYYNQTINEDPNFDARKYSHSIIVSNFNRQIKNIDNCMNYIKNKESVLLIGNGSTQYDDSGYECIESVDNDKICEYYKQIKCIVNDSFYESCSNVMVDALYNNCIIYSPRVVFLKPNSKYVLEKDIYYVYGDTCELYSHINMFDLFSRDSYNGYLIDTPNCNAFNLYIHARENITLTHDDLLVKTNMLTTKIGFITTKISENKLIDLYYLYGKMEIDKNLLGLSLFYDSYINEKTRKFNRNIFILIYSYYCGIINKTNYKTYIMRLLSTDIFHKETVLILSKLIRGYGGVQKTSFQLIQTIDLQYNIELISNSLSQDIIFNYYVNSLNNEIPNCIIARMTNTKSITRFINDNHFKFIINNKMNESLEWVINKKIQYICHNSMDPLNLQLIKHQDKVESVFTINNFHKKLLTLNGFKPTINLYNNYVFDTIPNVKPHKRKHYNIACIGRISAEKNIQCIIDGVVIYNSNNKKKINLYIIGDGNYKLSNINKYIIQTGRFTYEEIVNIYKKTDFVISASFTEGKPFSIIEALSNGIPCIHSNINGISEIITHGSNGLLFDLENYDKIKYDMTFDNMYTLNHIQNKYNVADVLYQAYNLDINQWKTMSMNAKKSCEHKYNKQYCIMKNLDLFKNKNTVIDNISNKKLKIFVNFKPDETIPYGGGNISVYYIIHYISGVYSNFEITYELETDIDIYLIIDPFKDRNGLFKKYAMSDVIIHRNKHNTCGQIVIRVNDCDKTRVVTNINKSREHSIITNFKDIDFFIFNSHFIKQYYFDKFEKNVLQTCSKYAVIINGCDQTIFTNMVKSIRTKINIVTHHWSDNMNKGYDTYYKLWKYTQTHKNANIEFVFIGKNVPEMFKKVPIHGPFVNSELSDELNKQHIYITDSIYDSCPNHVLEALSCGLPILYSNSEGGARELCTMSEFKVGEMYNTFDELLQKIDMIKNNYDFYRENIQKTLHLYEIKYSISKYYNVMLNIIYIYKSQTNVELLHENNIISIKCDDNYDDKIVLLNDNLHIKLVQGENLFAVNKNTYKNIKIIGSTYTLSEFGKSEKLYNDKINVLLCSDSKYFVGLFAVLHSVIQNTHYLDNIHWNFMIPIEETNHFSKILRQFECKMGVQLDKTIIYMDANILDPVLLVTKCYNGGGHLLNIGNLSRLLIGEFMEYDKLIYLDSDSIVQSDIIEPLIHFKLQNDLYAGCANKVHANNKKQIVIKMSNIINCDYNWKNVIGQNIIKDEYVYMGAPFVTNCKKWGNVYSDMIRIIKIHNNSEKGVYKLFTMSLQNIIFYNKTGNIHQIMKVIQDLGSKRKEWDTNDLIDKDVLDWSGIYKPWFSNGLYRDIWLKHDIMNLSETFGEISASKNVVETNIKSRK